MIAARASLCGQLRLSAASALVLCRDSLWTVADDCLDLHRYDLDGHWLGQWSLVPGVLPEDPVERKACKADFEAMALLPDGALLVLGSGSTARRRRGALFGEDQQVRPIDASGLYRVLGEHFQELNIEGAVVRGEQLLLAQRGNGKGGENALVLLQLQRVLADLGAGRLDAEALLEIRPVQLGELAGVPLGLTDLTLGRNGRLYYSAAAEATDSSYLDGDCLGSVIGWLDDALLPQAQRLLEPVVKIEGLCALADGNLLLVADADDPAVPAPLFRLDGAWLEEDPAADL